jgi:hypothetical protein
MEEEFVFFGKHICALTRGIGAIGIDFFAVVARIKSVAIGKME